jgi:hypothetical protein
MTDLVELEDCVAEADAAAYLTMLGEDTGMPWPPNSAPRVDIDEFEAGPGRCLLLKLVDQVVILHLKGREAWCRTLIGGAPRGVRSGKSGNDEPAAERGETEADARDAAPDAICSSSPSPPGISTG